MTAMIAPATASDYDSFTRLFLELETGDPPIDRDTFVRDILPTMLVARQQTQVVGYAFHQLFGDACYVRHIVTERSSRRSGVGRALMAATAERARAAGATRWRLNVKEANVAAVRLYESLGLARSFETVVARVRCDGLLGTLGQGAAQLQTREVGAGEAATIEARFDLPTGLVAKAGATKLLRVALTSDGQVAGYGCFDAAFPSVYPLRALSISAASSLLRHFASLTRPIEDPQRPWRAHSIQVVFEDAAEAAQHAIDGGAELVFRIVHMQGPVPARPSASQPKT